jgi:nitric oxide reductase subunit C
MLSKSAARAFFFIGTIGFSAIFLGLTLDTMRQVPKQTNAANLTPQAIEGKHLWDRTNCMGCHTL